MALTSTSFSKCSVSYGTDIARCGTVTACSPLPLEADELVTTYGTSPNYKIMESLFDYELEIAQCMVAQKGLGGFLKANQVIKKQGFESIGNDRYLVQPFVLARQTSVINNEYWTFTDGVLDTTNWAITATSPTGIPANVSWFNVGDRIYLNGLSDAGTQLTTSYVILTATLDGDTVDLVLTPQNAGSFLDAARVANPVSGFLTRGTANVSSFEKYCLETPGLNTNKNVPFWVEETRMAMCRSEQYRRFRRLLAENNLLYAEFGDIPEAQLNAQQADDFEKRWLNNVLWSKPINASQTINAYRTGLPEITIPAGSIVTAGISIGECIGRKANAVGFYEQHAECSRVKDLQGAQLNLPALFESIRIMSRVRKNNRSAAAMDFDIYTDEFTAKQFRTGMLAYYKAESQNMLEMMINLGAGQPKKAPMNFMYSSYPLLYPSGVTIHIITDEAFDDQLTIANAVNKPGIGRYLWIMDWTKNYVALANQRRVEHTLGKLSDISAFDSNLACVMDFPTKDITLISKTYAPISECPAGDLIISNFAGGVPEAVANPVGSYG